MDPIILLEDISAKICSIPFYGSSVKMVMLSEENAGTLEIDVIAALQNQDDRREFGERLKEVASHYDTAINFHQYKQ